MNKDKAGKHYWDSIWETNNLPKAVNPNQRGLNNYVDKNFHELFNKIFSDTTTYNLKLLEIGCANSRWLPYFAKEYGFKITGLDYSERGCDQARKILANESVEGEIVWADFFSPPDYMLEAYDVVVSFGVVEHFEDTSDCLQAFSKFLKPGGIIITIIPNLNGITGELQKIVNRPIFDIHVPLDREALALAHEKSGFTLKDCEYFLFINLGVLNFGDLKNKYFYKILVGIQFWVSKTIWVVEGLIPIFKPNRWTAPYIYCFGKKL
ncbi:hypothetical protein EFBL_3754 [Effusibacillus lacus]|uniref:Uncharacterized protein n=2 Tax=Effusibacillus lacus TaxID=1348429 RepID=A0A292YTI0_9BACL|nr:hypothetical protein EFBL_3754 [Effusibacillus lacus]